MELDDSTSLPVELWSEFEDRADGHLEDPEPILLDPPVPGGLMFISLKLYQCVLSRADLHELVARDQQIARETGRPAEPLPLTVNVMPPNASGFRPLPSR